MEVGDPEGCSVFGMRERLARTDQLSIAVHVMRKQMSIISPPKQSSNTRTKRTAPPAPAAMSTRSASRPVSARCSRSERCSARAATDPLLSGNEPTTMMVDERSRTMAMTNTQHHQQLQQPPRWRPSSVTTHHIGLDVMHATTSAAVTPSVDPSFDALFVHWRQQAQRDAQAEIHRLNAELQHANHTAMERERELRRALETEQSRSADLSMAHRQSEEQLASLRRELDAMYLSTSSSSQAHASEVHAIRSDLNEACRRSWKTTNN